MLGRISRFHSLPLKTFIYIYTRLYHIAMKMMVMIENQHSNIYNDLCAQKREDGEWMKHTLGYWEDEKVRLEYRPVHMDTLDDEIETFPPKARVY